MTTMKSKKKKSKAKASEEGKTVKKTTILKRKQLRQEKRQAKKVARRNFVSKKFKGNQNTGRQGGDEEIPSGDEKMCKESKVTSKKDSHQKSQNDHDKMKRDMKELKRQQKKQRKKQLLDANIAEEKNIKLLEKNLGLKRRKSKNLPKCFLDDGLDYLLDACDSSKISNLSENVFENEAEDNDPSASETEMDPRDEHQETSSDVNDSDQDVEMEDSEGEYEGESEGDDDPFPEDQEHDADTEVSDDGDLEEDDEAEKQEEEWEDIYGRKRDSDGNLVKATSAAESSSKYIPPALRNKGANLEDSEKKRIALEKLKKQIKGLLNRLAESNMYGISRDIEKLYNSNSRNDVNNSLADLLFSALVHETAIIPARLIMEHCMLVAILHANVGTEVGAYVLQQVVRKFHEEVEFTSKDADVDESRNAINNLLVILCYLYSWKIVQAPLIFDILNLLTERFSTKDIQLIILTLTNCGMSLRKDDPVALKSFILNVQAVAAQRKADDSRVQFMLEVLTGIKNNNVNKIPNYDPSHFEHLKKSLKVCLRESKFVTELNISYKDLINAESRGRWWIVGSAFTGNLAGTQRDEETKSSVDKEQYSDQLLSLARKMRMNTDIRREVFCIIMSAEDFMECAEKLVKLGTKNQTEREVVFVLTDCCMQEKEYNPYYGHVAVKLASLDRKYRVAMQFNIWDRVKQVNCTIYISQQLLSFCSWVT